MALARVGVGLAQGRSGAFALFALMLAILPAEAAEKNPRPGIGPEDHRVPVDSIAWPWAAIGRLNNTTGRICTATLVTPDTIVTAAHCVINIDTGLTVSPGALHFLAGYRRGEFVAHAVGREIRFGELPRAQRPAGPEAVAGDWAIVRIQPALAIRPITVGVLPPSATVATAPTDAIRLQRAGYSQDRPHMLAVHDGCRVTGTLAAGRVFITDCDATRGDSGSPLLLRQGDQATLVGVTSAIIESGEIRGTFFVPAAAFMAAIGAAAPIPSIAERH